MPDFRSPVNRSFEENAYRDGSDVLSLSDLVVCGRWWVYDIEVQAESNSDRDVLDRIQRGLERSGIKQKELAERLRIGAPMLSRILSGQRTLTVPLARKIEAILGVPLFGPEPENMPDLAPGFVEFQSTLLAASLTGGQLAWLRSLAERPEFRAVALAGWQNLALGAQAATLD